MDFVDKFFERMIQNLGAERARRCIDETLAAIGMRELRTADEVLVFADELTKRGGLFQVIGGALRVQAILRGAGQDSNARNRPRAKQRA